MGVNTHANLPEIITLRETADLLRVSPRTVQNLLHKGLPHFRVGALLRFRREEVLQFLTSDKPLTLHQQRGMSVETLNPSKD